MKGYKRYVGASGSVSGKRPRKKYDELFTGSFWQDQKSGSKDGQSNLQTKSFTCGGISGTVNLRELETVEKAKNTFHKYTDVR